MCTFGTGIGTAIFVDGKLVPNTELGCVSGRGWGPGLESRRANAEAKIGS
jgi:polyphosphate glucokinase